MIGAGTMGRQISLQVARHGFPVALYDIDASVLVEAEASQRQTVADWLAEVRTIRLRRGRDLRPHHLRGELGASPARRRPGHRSGRRNGLS